uniref:Uncharacterized protein n=2 Tax=Leersia perrieri TaxID=77586 RepID=A0A0D9W2S5_9ORYZ
MRGKRWTKRVEGGRRSGGLFRQMEDSGSSSPPAPALFRNKYWILRHGRSIPNERGIIVSSLENGTKPEFGLTPQGVEQARLAGESLRKELEELGVPLDSVKIRYSPFSRTMETAREVAGVLGVPFDTPSCIPWNFGNVILGHHMNCFHMRSSAILIVSHGDPLQIFQAVLKETKENSSFLDEVSDLKKRGMIASSVLSQHRKFALLTAELRRLV